MLRRTARLENMNASLCNSFRRALCKTSRSTFPCCASSQSMFMHHMVVGDIAQCKQSGAWEWQTLQICCPGHKYFAEATFAEHVADLTMLVLSQQVLLHTTHGNYPASLRL